ncbi:MAG: MFS transporter [Nitratireductor sp.]
MSARALLVYCGLLMSVSAFAVDITLPSFGAMVDALDTRYALVQWTITFYMVAAAFGQLLWGSASDRYGRRPVLAAGLTLFVAGCAVAALAPSITVLLGARALQGFGAAAAIVSSRAIIRDLYSGADLARNLAFATAIFAVGPIVAPLAGAGIAALFGWRAIFAVLALFGMFLLAALTRFSETIPGLAPDALSPATYLRRTRRLVGHPQSRHFLILSAVVMATMLLILASAPRIYESAFGITGGLFAVYFALHGAGIVIGQIVNRRLIAMAGIVPAMLVGNAVLILSATLILATALAGLLTPSLLAASFVLFATSYLVVYSNAAALVLDPHGDIAGFSASLYGFVSQIGGALAVTALVVMTGDGAVAFAGALLAICLTTMAMIAWWHWSRR